jgi:hypothetical protein
MQLAMSDSNKKGGVSVLLFHCLFNSNGSVTHFMHANDVELYRSLPNLYAVCISDTLSKRKKITAGFFIKTSYSHHDSDFIGALTNVISIDTGMKNLINGRSSFLPARIGISGEALPSEDEMLRLIVSHSLKHGVGGSA